MKLVHSSERNDFENIVTKLGFMPLDFEISEIPDKAANKEIYAVTGSIQIKRKSTNIIRSFGAGHGSAWLPQFELALRQGIFGAA